MHGMEWRQIAQMLGKLCFGKNPAGSAQAVCGWLSSIRNVAGGVSIDQVVRSVSGTGSKGG